MRIPSFMLLSLFLLLFAGVGDCQLHKHNIDPRYEQIKAEAFRLRNTDLSHRFLAEWRQVILDLAIFADHNNDQNGASALFLAGTLSLELYEDKKNLLDLRRAKQAFEIITLGYPSSSLADDAYIKLGYIFHNHYQDRVAATECFQKVVQNYQKSDQYGVAQLKLRELRGFESDRGPGFAKSVSRNSGALKIMLDPGHGGEDLGAEGVAGLLEKDVVLDLALKLQRQLESKGFNVELTRRRDEFVPLALRTQMANNWDADMFISLHTNASERGNLSGIQTFYLDNSGDKAAKLLAERENASLTFEGPQADVQYIISDLIQGHKIQDSKSLASKVQTALVSSFAKSSSQIRNLGVKTAPFFVLVGAQMPCILVEVMFIDNKSDAAILANAGDRRGIAMAIADGIAAQMKAMTTLPAR